MVIAKFINTTAEVNCTGNGRNHGRENPQETSPWLILYTTNVTTHRAGNKFGSACWEESVAAIKPIDSLLISWESSWILLHLKRIFSVFNY
jgi:hypothetical protein